MMDQEVGDTINLSKGEKEQKKVTITDVHESMFQLGGSHEKLRVEVATNKNGEENDRKMSMILKEIDKEDVYYFPSETENMTQAERYLEKWNILRRNGIPTVCSMRVVNDRTVAMGDMTTDGSSFFGKEIGIRAYEKRFIEKRPLKVTEEVFLSIDPMDLKQEIERVQKLAWDKGIILPDNDPYDLLVHPDGKWEVLVLDVQQLKPKGEADTIEELDLQKEDMWENVDVIRNYLLKVKQND